jgi:hypothetical protein
MIEHDEPNNQVNVCGDYLIMDISRLNVLAQMQSGLGKLQAATMLCQ